MTIRICGKFVYLCAGVSGELQYCSMVSRVQPVLQHSSATPLLTRSLSGGLLSSEVDSVTNTFLIYTFRSHVLMGRFKVLNIITFMVIARRPMQITIKSFPRRAFVFMNT